MLHKFGARVWIARILISWGIVAMLTGFVQAAIHLYVVRFLLGVAEAGFFPGIVLYLTYWFRQRQLAHAIALFCAANPVANVIGSPLSGVILDRVYWFGLASWRWLLILEGIPAILAGVLTYFLLPGRPAEARFLTAEEKGWITAELSREEQQKVATRHITATKIALHILGSLGRASWLLRHDTVSVSCRYIKVKAVPITCSLAVGARDGGRCTWRCSLHTWTIAALILIRR